ncbi:MAG: hypothetical protein IKU15_05460 [Clostridia bacterium]|nr:hypothetical protein [Clostridia bacterium]
MKKLIKNKTFCICLVLLLVLVIAGLCVIQIGSLRRTARNIAGRVFPDRYPRYVYYINNVLKSSASASDFLYKDVREVQINSERSYLVNHSRGFALGFPADAEYDFSAAQEFIKVKCDDFSAVVTKEYSTFEPGVESSKKYVAECLNKYILNDDYIEGNNIILHKNDMENIGEYPVQIIALTRTPHKGSNVTDNTYVYTYIYKEDVMFYRIMFKAKEYNDKLMSEVYKTLESFSEGVTIKGISGTFTDFKPIANKKWNQATKDLYEEIITTEKCKWGAFVPGSIFSRKYDEVHKLEEKLDAEFGGLLEYIFLCDYVPIDGMKAAYDDGKIIELTLQTANVMHKDLDGKNSVFEVMDGLHDEHFRKMAKDIKSLNKPVLFRLNNEMNSDWVGYSASACLLDPDIYVQVWRRIYDIFEEEGVDNAIWIFNPNDETFPPNGYNSSLAYYPGNGYVHMFGITGYNTGTYYAAEHGERWRTFDEIYSAITEHSEKDYGEFPWIITEFGSSSIGGDKVAWINDMFESLIDYPHIKMAFWFNAADMDERPERKGQIARPYQLDETPETTEAFSKGLKESKNP